MGRHNAQLAPSGKRLLMNRINMGVDRSRMLLIR